MPRFKIKSVFNSPRTSPPPDQQPSTVEDDDPPLTPLQLLGYKSTTHHKLLHSELAEELRLHIPPILQISHSWSLLYSLEQDGTSLNTLYSRVQPAVGESTTRRKGYLLVVMDTQHRIFGAYMNEYLRPLDKKHYYGNGDCFLWKAERDTIRNISTLETSGEQLRLKVFPYTSVNDYIIYSNHDFISIGSGNGRFGLYIGGNFESGATDSVETFGNEPLTTERFNILGLEIWKIN
ncbi:hypothetical protein OGAPHI_005446 [Ogataea philodendri]|uniref:Oxidation resistance protein 1 n=1 Tax=Ogataea philodendri TaxID=1378263 RepID=A0A9P8NXQ9_9ASCO|nr:uncharacterized protein OGAPHI_005446 [Ogataea philodendri]KAH3662198.1 hypothetical protein OGAPHI_005446 [Ogataea philodendri]